MQMPLSPHNKIRPNLALRIPSKTLSCSLFPTQQPLLRHSDCDAHKHTYTYIHTLAYSAKWSRHSLICVPSPSSLSWSMFELLGLEGILSSSSNTSSWKWWRRRRWRWRWIVVVEVGWGESLGGWGLGCWQWGLHLQCLSGKN